MGQQDEPGREASSGLENAQPMNGDVHSDTRSEGGRSAGEPPNSAQAQQGSMQHAGPTRMACPWQSTPWDLEKGCAWADMAGLWRSASGALMGCPGSPSRQLHASHAAAPASAGAVAGPASSSSSSSKPARGLPAPTHTHSVTHFFHSHSQSLPLTPLLILSITHVLTHSLPHSLTHLWLTDPETQAMRAGNSLDSKDSAVAQPLRFNSRIQSVKNAVADLRVSVKGAIAYREKCSLTLSAAMGATLALEQVLILCRAL